MRPSGHCTVLFQSLVTSPDEHFRSYLLEEAGYWPFLGQYRVEHPEASGRGAPKELEPVMAVLEKILLRGRVIPAPKEWAEFRSAPLAMPAASSGWSLRLRDLAAESPAEERFVREYLAEWLGPSWSVWVMPQVHMEALVPGKKYVDSGQRVDLLISHPFLAKPVVAEIDGIQHSNERQNRIDAGRTADLRANGFDVHRIPVAEVRSGEGRGIDALRDLLKPLRRFDQDLSRDLNDPIRRAGQLQVALFVALRIGLLDAFSPEPVSIWSDLAGRDGLQGSIKAVVRDFISLVRDLGTLYGLELFPGRVVLRPPQGMPGGVEVCFFGQETSPVTIHVDDLSVPWDIAWEGSEAAPALPVTLDRGTIERFLNRIFSKPGFLPGQWEIVERALGGHDSIALLPTSGGKSIAFQLAAMLTPGCTVVVDPIISLVRDQQFNLLQYGVDRVAAITSDLESRGDRQTVYEALMAGQVLLAYVAPERFQMSRFRKGLREMSVGTPVNYIVVDEVHCVSEWGIDFRTSYLRLGAVGREHSSRPGWIPPLLGLTGTASSSVLKDVRRELNISAEPIRPESMRRDELHLEVVRCSSAEKAATLQRLLFDTIPARLETSPERLLDTGRETRGGATPVEFQGVVFCPHVNGPFGVNDVSKSLIELGIDARIHSGRKPKSVPGSPRAWETRKRRTEMDFKQNRFPVLVATKSYGMGVDKENIRYTVHFNMPQSIESFYQEAGRAGRDGQNAYCFIILSELDPESNLTTLRDAPLELVRQRVDRKGRHGKDDVDRCLWFHSNAFRGKKNELEVMRGILSRLGPLSTDQSLHLSYSDDDQGVIEKALHRLLVLGVVRDYTKDYSNKMFDVHVGRVEKSAVVTALTHYVAGYSADRASVMERGLRRVAEMEHPSLQEFVLTVSSEYMDFLYEVIEGGRRRAILEMLLASKSPEPRAFEARIESYLQSTDYGRKIEALVAQTDAGLGQIDQIIADHLGRIEATGARGETARLLESYPDHPALLLLRALAEERAPDTDVATADSFIQQALAAAGDVYGVSAKAFAMAVGALFNVLSESSPSRARDVERLAASVRRDDRSSLREVVRRLGVRHAPTCSLALLLDAVGRMDSSVLP